jgi:ribosome maturation factor RimP
MMEGVKLTSLETKIKEVLEPVINDLGFKVYDIIYEKEAQDYYLRVFIEKDEVISSDDCALVSQTIDPILDEKDFIKGSYLLEVSSPGLERRIRDDAQLERAINSKIEVHTYKKVNEDKVLIGNLISFSESNIILDINNENIEIDRNNISTMKTVYEWED